MNMATGLQAANTKVFSVRNETYLHVLYINKQTRRNAFSAFVDLKERVEGCSGGSGPPTP